jgi:hypothetical protein
VVPDTAQSQISFNLTNNIVERSWLTIKKISGSNNPPLTFHAYNNLFRGGELELEYISAGSNPAWRIHDNLFHACPQTLSGNGTGNVQRSHNGFISGTSNSLGGSSNKTGLTANYLSGPLGGYYYPTSGGTGGLHTLINAGSRSPGSAGLYHHTVKTAYNTKAGSDTWIAIGFHYIGTELVDGAVQPIDTNGNGVADYLQDWNGNGLVDSGETDWQDASDPGLTVWITRPKPSSNLH